MSRGRHSLPITEIERRLADEYPALSKNQRRRYALIIAGKCVECSQLAKPGFRRCEVCALKNIERVEESRRRQRLGS